MEESKNVDMMRKQDKNFKVGNIQRIINEKNLKLKDKNKKQRLFFE